VAVVPDMEQPQLQQVVHRPARTVEWTMVSGPACQSLRRIGVGVALALALALVSLGIDHYAL